MGSEETAKRYASGWANTYKVARVAAEEVLLPVNDGETLFSAAHEIALLTMRHLHGEKERQDQYVHELRMAQVRSS